MSIVRTAAWVILAMSILGFLFMNWGESAQVKIWPLGDGYLLFEWPVGFIALVFFLLGLVPMWLIHKGARWRLSRRISSLENTVRATSSSLPIATSTQLEAQAEAEESRSG